MRLGELRLSDLGDHDALRTLVTEPESESVERKRTAEVPTLAKVISAFANATGGWLLLGVDDNGDVHGWTPKGRSHLRDWLRDILEERIDPLPQFQAATFELDGQLIGVVRIPRSHSAPHFIADTGEVFERCNGQTRRMPGPRVRAMTLAGRATSTDARRRLDDAPAARDLAITLGAPREGTAMDARAIASIVRIAIADAAAGFGAWVFSDDAINRTQQFLTTTAAVLNDRHWMAPPEANVPRTTAGGHIGELDWDGHKISEAAAGWDRTGIGGVRLAGSRPDNSGIFYLLSNEARDLWLQTSVEYLLAALDAAEVGGPVAMRWDLYGVRGADVTTVRGGNTVAAQGVIPDHYQNTVAIDLEFDLGERTAEEIVADLWLNLERLAGARTY